MHSQQSKIDSLTIEFQKAKQDTVKAKILAEIGIAAYYTNFDLASIYNDSLIQFSKGRTKKYEALGYRMRGTLQLINGDFDESESSYKKSLTIFNGIEDKGYQGALLSNLATLYARQNEIEKADSLYLEAIEVLKDVKDDKQTVNCYINLGINALNANKLENATNYFLKTLNLADEQNNKNYQFYSYNQLGTTFLKRNMYAEAEKNLIQAETIGKEIEDYSGLASTYNLFGVLFDEYKNHSKALDYFILSKDAAESVGDKEQLSRALVNVGRQYKFLNKFDEAKSSFDRALELSKALNDSSSITFVNLNKANLLLEQKLISKAEESILEANRFLPKIPDQDYHVAYKEIAKNYSILGINGQAYKYLKIYADASDSLYIKNDLKKIADISAKYELEKKEKVIAQNQALVLEKELELKSKQRLVLVALLFATVTTIILLVFLYRNILRKLKAERLKEAFNKGLNSYLKNKYSLKERELNLWLVLVEGKSEKELAELFFKSVDTIKNWRKSLYKKLKAEGESFKQKNAVDLYYKEKETFSTLND
ncbi:tetratricopeptide repeat protein [Winogradskyella wandonensis]|uniref:Tetratricopeptide repeat protein n=1 Tax=Winogradskyella wandonensis TaxID=1442586 RepID=A0A4R1KRP2_9FLAO|nr:tetratricopeptide repeat protein [Winogradskyella wandonensis]